MNRPLQELTRHQQQWLDALKALRDVPELAFMFSRTVDGDRLLLEQVDSLYPIIEGRDAYDFQRFWETQSETRTEILRRINIYKDKVAQPFALLIPFWIFPKHRNKMLRLWVYLPSDLQVLYSYYGYSAPDSVAR